MVLNDPFDDGSIATAPYGLWLLGEEGYLGLLVRDADLKDDVRRQFPEAKIYIPGSLWGPTLYHDPYAIH